MNRSQHHRRPDHRGRDRHLTGAPRRLVTPAAQVAVIARRNRIAPPNSRALPPFGAHRDQSSTAFMIVHNWAICALTAELAACLRALK
jgi:hypothetical protein